MASHPDLLLWWMTTSPSDFNPDFSPDLIHVSVMSSFAFFLGDGLMHLLHETGSVLNWSINSRENVKTCRRPNVHPPVCLVSPTCFYSFGDCCFWEGRLTLCLRQPGTGLRMLCCNAGFIFLNWMLISWYENFNTNKLYVQLFYILFIMFYIVWHVWRGLFWVWFLS